MSSKRFALLPLVALCLWGPAEPALAADEACEAQSRELLQRLRAEVLVDLDEQQQQKVSAIVMEVCESHVQEIENRGWLENADKAGNERLKRKFP